MYWKVIWRYLVTDEFNHISREQQQQPSCSSCFKRTMEFGMSVRYSNYSLQIKPRGITSILYKAKKSLTKIISKSSQLIGNYWKISKTLNFLVKMGYIFACGEQATFVGRMLSSFYEIVWWILPNSMGTGLWKYLTPLVDKLWHLANPPNTNYISIVCTMGDAWEFPLIILELQAIIPKNCYFYKNIKVINPGCPLSSMWDEWWRRSFKNRRITMKYFI